MGQNLEKWEFYSFLFLAFFDQLLSKFKLFVPIHLSA